jgi:hypothetical protein
VGAGQRCGILRQGVALRCIKQNLGFSQHIKSKASVKPYTLLQPLTFMLAGYLW